jgi:CRP/FNR family transcriptional regulator, cyclic AMP receptor protein
METLEQMLGAHPFFAGLDPSFIGLASGCAHDVSFAAGEFVCHEGDAADRFYLVREGHVALQISAPGRGVATFLTVGPGEVFGINWLAPPYRWSYDARAVEKTHAVALEATCLRVKCENEPALGYALTKRVLPVLIERLHACRAQLLDLYGVPS